MFLPNIHNRSEVSFALTALTTVVVLLMLYNSYLSIRVQKMTLEKLEKNKDINT